MEPFSARTHAFYLRFWVEPRDLADSSPEWRGVIEHLNNGEKRYFTDLRDVIEFLTPYLAEWDVPLRLPPSRRRWQSRMSNYFRRRF
jgi:hypothetical protein